MTNRTDSCRKKLPYYGVEGYDGNRSGDFNIPARRSKTTNFTGVAALDFALRDSKARRHCCLRGLCGCGGRLRALPQACGVEGRASVSGMGFVCTKSSWGVEGGRFSGASAAA
jgi:hypothetical protein